MIPDTINNILHLHDRGDGIFFERRRESVIVYSNIVSNIDFPHANVISFDVYKHKWEIKNSIFRR